MKKNNEIIVGVSTYNGKTLEKTLKSLEKQKFKIFLYLFQMINQQIILLK